MIPAEEGRESFDLEFQVEGPGHGVAPLSWVLALPAGAGAAAVSSLASTVDAELPAGMRIRDGNLLVLGEDGEALDRDD